MARRPKLTDELSGRVLDAIREGCTIEAACSAGPIARSTFYEWLREGRESPASRFGAFVAEVELAELDAERTLVAVWRAQAPSDWRAAAELLARRFPERWRRPNAIELTGPNGAPMAVEVTIEQRAQELGDKLRAFLGAEVDDADDGRPPDDGEAA